MSTLASAACGLRYRVYCMPYRSVLCCETWPRKKNESENSHLCSYLQ